MIIAQGSYNGAPPVIIGAFRGIDELHRAISEQRFNPNISVIKGLELPCFNHISQKEELPILLWTKGEGWHPTNARLFS